MSSSLIRFASSSFRDGTAPSAPGTVLTNPSSDVVLSGGNLILTAVADAADGANARSTTNYSTGKKYFEFTTTNFAAGTSAGVCNATLTNTMATTGSVNSCVAYGGSDSTVFLYNNGLIYSMGGAPVSPPVIGIAVDIGARLWWVTLNGTIWCGTSGASDSDGDPVSGVHGYNIASVTGNLYAVLNVPTNTVSGTVNFGATAYAYTPPFGFGNW